LNFFVRDQDDAVLGLDAYAGFAFPDRGEGVLDLQQFAAPAESC
jgi:hypothetical protein